MFSKNVFKNVSTDPILNLQLHYSANTNDLVKSWKCGKKATRGKMVDIYKKTYV